MEVLSGVASVVAVIQIAEDVIKICGHYARKVSSAKKEIQDLVAEVTSLRDILTRVESSQDDTEKLYTPDPRSKQLAETSIEECKASLQEVVRLLNPGDKQTEMHRYGARALAWPSKSTKISDLIQKLGRQKNNLHLCLSLDQQ
jgi:hypothetical protein